MIKNFKLLSILLVFSVLFTACSSKSEPKEPLITVSKEEILDLKLKEQRIQADLCQKPNTLDQRVACYGRIADTNSFAMLRLAIYNADRKKDYEKTTMLFQQAMDAGNYYANLGLAYMYYSGRGVPQDYDKSYALLLKTYEKDPNAAFQLSKFYLEGLGNVPRDPIRALQLIEIAAKKGLQIAQKKAYGIYINGAYGIEKNEEKANFWKEQQTLNNENSFISIYKL